MQYSSPQRCEQCNRAHHPDTPCSRPSSLRDPSTNKEPSNKMPVESKSKATPPPRERISRSKW